MEKMEARNIPVKYRRETFCVFRRVFAADESWLAGTLKN